MDKVELSNNIYPELLIEFNDEISNGTLRLNTDTLSRIFKILQQNDFAIIGKNNSLDSASFANFEEVLRQWVQVENNELSYVPTDQILQSLGDSGWIIIPPGGTVID